MPKKPSTNKLTVVEAGRRGGETVSARYGPAFYSDIGKRGGEVTKTHGPGFFSKIGKLGGTAVSAKRGPEFYARIGQKGGETVKAKTDPSITAVSVVRAARPSPSLKFHSRRDHN